MPGSLAWPVGTPAALTTTTLGVCIIEKMEPHIMMLSMLDIGLG